MKQLILIPSQARKIILHAAGLSGRAQFGQGREAVYKLIDHLGYVQLDTIMSLSVPITNTLQRAYLTISRNG